MQHYYLNLQKDKKDLSFETNVKISDGIRYTANEVFSNFENYLKNVLRSLENKEIRAKWRKINSKNQATKNRARSPLCRARAELKFQD